MTAASVFRVFVRVVFILAFISFMSASIHHIATYFHDFEPDGSDWTNSYMLAVSIDLTNLILTIGVMFFRKQMPWYAQLIVWFFIIVLTAFSWTVNWEYANLYQAAEMKNNTFLAMLNPILASSFAFLNLAYAIVSEFFNARVITAQELQAEADRLEALEEQQKRLDAYRERNKKVSLIQRATETAKEFKKAAHEVLEKQMVNDIQESTPILEEVFTAEEAESEATFEHGVSTDEIEIVVPETPALSQSKTTKKLPRLADVSRSKSVAPVNIKSRSKLTKNTYSKSEAAQLAKCRVSEIENAVQTGQLLLAANSDKVLKSSLRNFIVERRKVTA